MMSGHPEAEGYGIEGCRLCARAESFDGLFEFGGIDCDGLLDPFTRHGAGYVRRSFLKEGRAAGGTARGDHGRGHGHGHGSGLSFDVSVRDCRRSLCLNGCTFRVSAEESADGSRTHRSAVSEGPAVKETLGLHTPVCSLAVEVQEAMRPSAVTAPRLFGVTPGEEGGEFVLVDTSPGEENVDYGKGHVCVIRPSPGSRRESPLMCPVRRDTEEHLAEGITDRESIEGQKSQSTFSHCPKPALPPCPRRRQGCCKTTGEVFKGSLPQGVRLSLPPADGC